MTTRVAIAGFGAWGQMHARAIAAIGDAEVVAVYCHSDTSEAAAGQALPSATPYRDYGVMLRAGGFDVVNVTVPNHVHAEFTIAALDAGKHVFAEKPLGLTLVDVSHALSRIDPRSKLQSVLGPVS